MTIGTMAEDAATLPLPSGREARRAALVALAAGALTGIALWQRMALSLAGPAPEETAGLYVGRLLRQGTPWNLYNYAPNSHIPLHLLGLGDAAGGLLGARLVAAILGAATLAFSFAATRALFGSGRVAAWAALLLALQAPLVFTARLATGEGVALFFCSAALWLLVEGLRRRGVGWLLCMLASVSFSVAVLSHYPALALAPAALVVVAVRRPRLLFATALPSALLLADYAHRHWSDLGILLRNHLTRLEALGGARGPLALEIAAFTAPLCALALGGLIVQARRAGLRWRALRLQALLLLAAIPLVALHLISGDATGLREHLAYPLLALAPLAAWSLHRLARRSAALALALTAVIAGLGLRQTAQLDASYPDLRAVIAYLRPRLAATTTVLSEEGFLLRYAFPAQPRENFAELTFFDNDRDGRHTPQDVIDGVWDGKVDYVLTTGTVAPALVEKLRVGVLPHRYHLVLERPGPGGAKTQLWKRSGVRRAPG